MTYNSTPYASGSDSQRYSVSLETEDGIMIPVVAVATLAEARQEARALENSGRGVAVIYKDNKPLS